MSVGKVCSREVVYIYRPTSILKAARLMRTHHVGDLVVVDEDGVHLVPVGILTDRDIVVEVCTRNVDMSALTAGDVMSLDLLVAAEDDSISVTLERMRVKGVRRAPVVNSRGHLVGILTADDLLELLAEEISALSRLVRRGREREAEHLL